ncbi:MAG: accessory gene regulator B family protein [Oscillospiraceae bacterium]|nr:accessory gene regulator B family protein [Oscillospiraceae bacterium]MCL2278823.1 accessory gene regulator B family protein [Oscillospiraceae bacterium]
MIAQMSKKLSSFFIAHEIISVDDREVYEYSFEVIISTFISFLALAVFAIITCTVGYTALYLLGFIPLRVVAGGYHAKNHFRCITLFMCIYGTYLLLLTLFPYELLLQLIVATSALSLALVYLLAPSEDRNKPISDEQKAIYKRKSKIVIICFAAIIGVLSVFISDLRIPLSLSLGNLTVAISLLTNFAKNKKKYKEME